MISFDLLDAAAGSANAAEANPIATVGMFAFWILIFVVMYFVLLRPQRKKQKDEEEMRSSVEIGDDVTTIGGIVGRVIAVRDDDETFVMETGSDRTRMRFKKWAISSIDTPEKQQKKETEKEKKGRKEKNKEETEE